MTVSSHSRRFIRWFEDISLRDISLVGGKNAALGEMYANLTSQGIKVPGGFAITADAYRYFIENAGLERTIRQTLRGLDTKNVVDLKKRGSSARAAILKARFPAELAASITHAYRELGKRYGKNPDVAVRSSATAEDLPGASFAGQQETYLNVRGERELLTAVKKGTASLFTDRAISYRVDKGFSHFDVALSVAVQKMVRSDLASSGVTFTLDTESGFDKVVIVTGSYGLGEMVVQGKVVPDEWVIFKPTLAQGKRAIISKKLGRKNQMLIYGKTGTKAVSVNEEDRSRFSLTDREVLTLAKWSVKIEEYFSKKYRRRQPMDIEWAKDGKTGELFVVQARPETVKSLSDSRVFKEYRLTKKGTVLVRGIAVGDKIGAGHAKVIYDPRKIQEFNKGEILVTTITDPDWEPIMKIASGVVTDSGGRTSHAAIVSRELGIPCIVGTKNATRVLKTGTPVTVDCASGEAGTVYKGILPFTTIEHRLDKIPKTKTKIMVNIGSPDEAFRHHALPAKGVGLGRLEFIIAAQAKIHPNALIDYPKLKSAIRNLRLRRGSGRKSQFKNLDLRITNYELRRLIAEIEKATEGYKDKRTYYIDKLAEGMAKIGAAFWPHEVIIRFSDFKTNEYRNLVGGAFYEPLEENPMLGWRGASRYYDPKFKAAFELECKAMKKAREEMGLTNITPMIPFCRTPEEGRRVLAVMENAGLSRRHTEKRAQTHIERVPRKPSSRPPQSAVYTKVYAMCEIPSNILLADEFLEIFDGFSIGSNDLTQLTLGLDRDSGIVSHVGNENDPAVKQLITAVIAKCRARKKYIGICGQAPSDYPDFVKFLVSHGIMSISLNPDAVIKTTFEIHKVEMKCRR